jgi:hypothetical protein
VCGNGVAEGTEDCDGADLAAADCTDVGFWGGNLTCNANCTFNSSGCSDCGDGNIDAGEACDGAALGMQTCTTQGFTGGTLACQSDCDLELGGCMGPVCATDAVPPGDPTCPAACTSCDMVNNVCNIVCTSTSCDNMAIDCPANWACNVSCNATTACTAATVNCPADYACDISCDGTSPCDDAIINCGDGTCNVTCTGTTPCDSVDLFCGARDSAITCTQVTSVIDPALHPAGGSSCGCTSTGC